jgi:hypothetical protein
MPVPKSKHFASRRTPKKAASADRRSVLGSKWVLAALLIGLALAVYWPALDAGFIWQPPDRAPIRTLFGRGHQGCCIGLNQSSLPD